MWAYRKVYENTYGEAGRTIGNTEREIERLLIIKLERAHGEEEAYGDATTGQRLEGPFVREARTN